MGPGAVITVAGQRYGTARDIAQALGPDITAARVRDWARRGLLTGHHLPGQGRGTTWYRLDHAATTERTTRQATRGRPRSLDTKATAA